MPTRSLNFAQAALLDKKTAALDVYRIKSTGKWAKGFEKISAGVRTRSYNDSVQVYRTDSVEFWLDGKLARVHTINTGKTNFVFGLIQVVEVDAVSTPEIAYIPATDEEWPAKSGKWIAGDDPAKFAPLLKADGVKWARIWTSLTGSYGLFDAWAKNGIKTIVTTTFREGSWKLSDSSTPATYVNFLPETVKRFASASIVQFGNELQYDQYRPTDVAPTVEGLKKVCDLYYRPLALKIGRERMAGPSILPHHDGPKWMKLFVDAGFYDPAITRFSDYHLYFGAGTGKQQIVDTVGACDALLPKGIERISSEFGKDVHDANLDYSRLESNYATYATLGISPMAHFMGGTMMRFQHTKGIYSRDGKRINDDVRDCLVKAGAKVQAVGAATPVQ